MPAALSDPQQRAWRLSLALTLLRLLLAPLMMWMAWRLAVSWPLVLALFAAFASDILDGRVLAWAGVLAPGLRTLDSAVDTVFYLATALAAWHRHPADIDRCLRLILLVVALEVLNNLLGLLKYGRTPAYHARSAKVFGVALFVTLALLLGGAPRSLLPITLTLGVVTQVESLAITILLRAWTHDVPSVWHAWQRRRGAR